MSVFAFVLQYLCTCVSVHMGLWIYVHLPTKFVSMRGKRARKARRWESLLNKLGRNGSHSLLYGSLFLYLIDLGLDRRQKSWAFGQDLETDFSQLSPLDVAYV